MSRSVLLLIRSCKLLHFFSKTAMQAVLLRLDFSHLDSFKFKQTLNCPRLSSGNSLSVTFEELFSVCCGFCLSAWAAGLSSFCDCHFSFASLPVQSSFLGSCYGSIIPWERATLLLFQKMYPISFWRSMWQTEPEKQHMLCCISQSNLTTSQIFEIFSSILIFQKHKGHKCYYQLLSLSVWRLNLSCEVSMMWSFCCSVWTPQDSWALFCISGVLFPSSVSLSIWPVIFCFNLIFHLFMFLGCVYIYESIPLN